MIGKLEDTLQFHQRALELRSYRQQMLASNIANADTPGYKARDIDFASALKAAVGSESSTTLTQSASAHLSGGASTPMSERQVLYRTPTQPSIDGNTVEMDNERAQFADNAVRMEASLTFLNGQIKTMLAAIQG
jgi:flagellar basal-body rod protein FlgB